jgi:hypothetical protein
MYFYHWTHRDALPSIRQHGLTAGRFATWVTDSMSAWEPWSRATHGEHRVLLRFEWHRGQELPTHKGESAWVLRRSVPATVLEILRGNRWVPLLPYARTRSRA